MTPTGERPAVSAHRGGGERAPAGTIEAFRDGVASGAEYVEFDVQRTADARLIVWHDPAAERAGLHPARLTRAELEARIGRAVPGLDDVLALLGDRTRAHLDLKGHGYEEEAVGRAVDRLGAGRIVVTGLDESVAATKRLFPPVRAALSLGRGWHEVPVARWPRTRYTELRPAERVARCGADAVAVHFRLARAGVLAVCARRGIGTMVWTVNDARLIRSLLADGRVDVLITDRPRFTLAVRDGTRRDRGTR